MSPPPPHGHDDVADLGALVEDLEADRALSGGGARVVVGVDVRAPVVPLEGARRARSRVVVGRARLLGPRRGSVRSLSTLARGAVAGTKRVAGMAPPRAWRREGDAEGVVAGRGGHDAPPALLRRRARRAR